MSRSFVVPVPPVTERNGESHCRTIRIPPPGGSEVQNFEWELEYQQNYAYCQHFAPGNCSPVIGS